MTTSGFTALENEEPACGWFESTVQLMDGELTGGARAEALNHVSACDICSPLVRGWSQTAEHLEDGLLDASERAKPALFQVPGHVLQALAPAPPPTPRPWWAAFRVQALAGLSAAVMTALVLLPAHPTLPVSAPKSVAVASPAPALAHPATPIAVTPVAPNDCHVHMLAFDGADGMVYRTETDGMTVIWVNEHEGA
jgi:hypothetical protein